MRHVWVLTALLLAPGFVSGQAPGTLHVEVTLQDATGKQTPVPRYVLLISDNPATSEPRRVFTSADGVIEIKLPQGLYTVESDRPTTFLGKGYQWTEMVNVAAGGTITLQLTAGNAESVPVTSSSSSGTDAALSDNDPSLLPAKWQDSVVAVWSPTARASGFVVDSRGLIATSRSTIGEAASVEVQLSASLKVPARVLFSAPANGAAVVWIDPELIAGRPPLPLQCPPAKAPSLADGDEITAIGSPLRGPRDQEWGDVTGFLPRGIESNLRLSFGSAGGPVFNKEGAVAGITSLDADAEWGRRDDVVVVRAGVLCEAVSAAQAQMSGAAPPEATRLPVDPAKPFPADGLEDSPGGAGPMTPTATSSSDFDVAFLTPPMIARARQRSGGMAGATPRSPEAEARLGLITEFGAWSDYFSDMPPVLVVRVTPKLVEGFWKRLAREAARTQGAVFPPFKDFKTSFLRMSASCGGAEVTPIHPFVLEHRASDKGSVREGLYVFGPEAFGPQCGGRVTLTLSSEKEPDKGETIVIDTKAIDQLWQAFAPYRAAGG